MLTAPYPSAPPAARGPRAALVGPAALRVATVATALAGGLAAGASAAGLFVAGLYRDPAAIQPALRAQDVVTLAALAVLVPAVGAARPGSVRALLLWVGLAGYLTYTYAGAAYAYAFNVLFLAYVGAFVLSAVALGALLVGLDADGVRSRFDATPPRRAVAGFLLAMGAGLGAFEVAEVVGFLATGVVPALLTRAQAPTNYVYVQDLGVVVPLSVLTAVLLWRRRPWGDVLAALLLVKAGAMGLALLAMAAFSARAGVPVGAGFTLFSAALAAGGLGLGASILPQVRG